jgi:hypothetical protein
VRKNFFSQRVPDSWNKIPPCTEAGHHSEDISQCIPETQANRRYHLMETDDDQTSRYGAHDVLALYKRPYLGHGESSFKYSK